MPKCIEWLTCDWLISNLCYQAIEQVYLIKRPVSVSGRLLFSEDLEFWTTVLFMLELKRAPGTICYSIFIIFFSLKKKDSTGLE